MELSTNTPTQSVWKGRVVLLSLITFFALPAVIAQAILSNHWYQSGVTNKGVLIEPLTTYQSLGTENPYQTTSWQLAYRVPEVCDDFCREQLYLLGQSHTALGKYKERVTPVLLLTPSSDASILALFPYQVVQISQAFSQQVQVSEFVIVDPLGQLVMRYPQASDQPSLVTQSKGLLADFRKLLKLSRVG